MSELSILVSSFYFYHLSNFIPLKGFCLSENCLYWILSFHNFVFFGNSLFRKSYLLNLSFPDVVYFRSFLFGSCLFQKMSFPEVVYSKKILEVVYFRSFCSWVVFPRGYLFRKLSFPKIDVSGNCLFRNMYFTKIVISRNFLFQRFFVWKLCFPDFFIWKLSFWGCLFLK